MFGRLESKRNTKSNGKEDKKRAGMEAFFGGSVVVSMWFGGAVRTNFCCYAQW